MRKSLLALPVHDGSALHVPEPAPALGATVPVLLRAPAASRVRRIHERTTPDGEPHYACGVVNSTVDGPAGPETWWRAGRWARIDDDVLCFLREAADEVSARRASGSPLRLAGVCASTAENMYGGATVLCGEDGSVQLPADGPSIQIRRLR